jgi:hypothetical protein
VEDSIGKQKAQDIRSQRARSEQSCRRRDHRVDADQDDDGQERGRDHCNEEERANRVQVAVTGEPEV